jgi:hypothetical protein
VNKLNKELVMALEDDIKKVNLCFDGFLGEIRTVRGNVDKEFEFTRGYLKCMTDMIEGTLNDNNSVLMDIIEKRMDMKSRAEVLDELTGGLEKLFEAYNRLAPNTSEERASG